MRPALIEFIEEQKFNHMTQVLHAVRRPTRDTMQEARYAGMVEAYENLLMDLDAYAKRKLDEAKQ